MLQPIMYLQKEFLHVVPYIEIKLDDFSLFSECPMLNYLLVDFPPIACI